jgi:hypothetical protein
MRRYGDCCDGHWRGHRGRGALGPATSPARPGGLGPTPAATDVGTATAATDVGTATSATDVGTATSATASLYPVPSMLTDR